MLENHLTHQLHYNSPVLERHFVSFHDYQEISPQKCYCRIAFGCKLFFDNAKEKLEDSVKSKPKASSTVPARAWQQGADKRPARHSILA